MNDTWWVKASQLDDRQKAVIDLPLTDSHLIVGPPGSGKTNLLLLRGSQLVHSAKPNVLILVFTRTLREFAATGGHNYAFNIDKIKTLNRWQFDFLYEYGITPENDSNFLTERRKRLVQIQEIVAKHRLSNLYDAIILDEAQDYLSGEIDIFLKLGQVVFAAADSRQHIYKLDGNDSTDLENHFINIYPLDHHYRNGQKICLVADELAKGWGKFEPMMPTCKYIEEDYPSSVQIYDCLSLDTQVEEACANLERQMKAYPDDYLGVLCPTRLCLKNVWPLIQESNIGRYSILQSAEEGYERFDIERPICVCTVHAAKGLEFRAVHLLETENMKKSPLNRNIAYTAVTRAKTSLSIYHTKPIPGYFDSALSIIREPVETARLDELFV